MNWNSALLGVWVSATGVLGGGTFPDQIGVELDGVSGGARSRPFVAGDL